MHTRTHENEEWREYEIENMIQIKMKICMHPLLRARNFYFFFLTKHHYPIAIASN